MSRDSSAGPGIPAFGYPLDFEQLDVALRYGPFQRGLALDTPVRGLADHVKECRVLWESGSELPEGIFWFEGISDGPMIFQVAVGAAPGGACVAPISELHDDHPLAAALGWAEHFWQEATAVPKPLFEIHEAVVTHPGGADVVIDDRKFLRGHWSYTVIAEGRRQDLVESSLRPRPHLDSPRAWVQDEPVSASRFGATLTRAKLRGK